MKKIITTIIIAIIVSIVYFNMVSAYNLDLLLSADKTDVKVGDEVTVTLTLSKGMQAADFTINYDSNLLQFKSGSLGNNFYNANTPGKIVCSWFDTNDTSKFTFTFNAISSGVASFTTTTENFYDGNLKAATSYSEGNLNVTLLSAGTNISGNTSTLPNNSNTQQPTTSNTDQTITQQPSSGNTQTTVQQPSTSQTSTIPTITQPQTTTEKTSTLVQGTNNQQQIQAISNDNKQATLTANNSLPQTGNNLTLFVPIIFVIMAIAVISKMKLNRLRDI